MHKEADVLITEGIPDQTAILVQWFNSMFVHFWKQAPNLAYW